MAKTTSAKKVPAKKVPAKKVSAKKVAAKKVAAKKTAAKKTPAKKVPAKKVPARKTAAKKAATSKPASRTSVSLPKQGQDPKGGLTAKGRQVYNEATGGHLRPGVKGAANTPEKKQRKGSFLRRHFANPPGPVAKDGKPTRQALQAAAWGEPVPKSVADEKKLAAKGRKLLKQSHDAKS